MEQILFLNVTNACFFLIYLLRLSFHVDVFYFEIFTYTSVSRLSFLPFFNSTMIYKFEFLIFNSYSDKKAGLCFFAMKNKV